MCKCTPGIRTPWCDKCATSSTDHTDWKLHAQHRPEPKTTGLSLAEAVNSGRPFRRAGTALWFTRTPGITRDTVQLESIHLEAAISDDWEIKPEPKKPEVVELDCIVGTKLAIAVPNKMAGKRWKIVATEVLE